MLGGSSRHVTVMTSHVASNDTVFVGLDFFKRTTASIAKFNSHLCCFHDDQSGFRSRGQKYLFGLEISCGDTLHKLRCILPCPCHVMP